MDESGAGAAAPMSREGVDHALRGLAAERDRISAALVDLEAREGLRLLRGARPVGETCRRWDAAQRRLALLWRLFEAYREVLDKAAALRDRWPHPDAAMLAELSGMLAGASVPVPDDEVPLADRAPPGQHERHITPAEAVAQMSDAFESAAAEVAAADTARSALLLPLEEAEAQWRDAARLAHSLDGTRHPELDRVGRELSALARVIRTDPLSLVRDGRADTTRLDRLRGTLRALGDELVGVVRMRDGYDAVAAQLKTSIEEVERVERDAHEAYGTVLVKIVSTTLPEPARGLAAGLHDRLAALERLREAGRWVEIAGRVVQLEHAAEEALERARSDLRLSAGLLERRAELRGRLDAYRAKAARLGLLEDPPLRALYDEAHEILWTAPCDLRRATTLLGEYQRTIRAGEAAR